MKKFSNLFVSHREITSQSIESLISITWDGDQWGRTRPSGISTPSCGADTVSVMLSTFHVYCIAACAHMRFVRVDATIWEYSKNWMWVLESMNFISEAGFQNMILYMTLVTIDAKIWKNFKVLLHWNRRWDWCDSEFWSTGLYSWNNDTHAVVFKLLSVNLIKVGYRSKCHSIRHQTPKFPTLPKSYATIFFGLLRTPYWSN